MVDPEEIKKDVRSEAVQDVKDAVRAPLAYLPDREPRAQRLVGDKGGPHVMDTRPPA